VETAVGSSNGGREGMSWWETLWEERYMELQAYKESHGDCLVPQDYPDNRSLGYWVDRQRQNYRKGKLSMERVSRLEAVAFDWDPFGTQWEEMFEELVAYKEAVGDCLVPASYPYNRPLGRWVDNQRQSYRKGKLSEERLAWLEAVGFGWDPLGTQWEEIFDELVAYKEAHGDCLVPREFPDNPPLGNWVTNQRTSYHAGNMPEERVARLEAVGFDWDPLGTQWEVRLDELLAYQEAHGDYLVPRNFPDKPRLGLWVETQRKSYHEGYMLEERAARLEAVGFNWALRRQPDEKG